MVPTDYRLDQVAVRIMERLEGTRRSFQADPERAEVEFRRVALEMVEAASSEYREGPALGDPEPQIALLRREIVELFLPRYHRSAMEMNARERGGFGLGPLAEPIGRIGLVLFALLVVAVDSRTLLATPPGWLIGASAIALPFSPDILRGIHQRRYRNELQVIADDMAAIQDKADTYTPVGGMLSDPLPSSKARKAAPQKETP